MAHGLYCYKFIEAMNGDRYRIQFHRENYTGEAFEIEKMGVTPFTINIDGQGEDFTRPIVKSSLSIQIIDTEQFDYSMFYTASAFEWRVDLARTNTETGQRFVWVGYLTPDSFQQACVKGATISLTARDNLGYLDEVDFDKVTYSNSEDYGDKIASVYDIIRSAIAVTTLGDLVRIDFNVQTAGEISNGYTELLDLCINTRLFDGKTWGEALRMVLSSFGWQLRPAFIKGDNSTDMAASYPMHYEVIDVAKLGNPESWNGAIEPLFLMNSKQMSIQPNWRELKIEQDYGVIGNFFPMPTEEDYIDFTETGMASAYRRYAMTRTGALYTDFDPNLTLIFRGQKFDQAFTNDVCCLNAKTYANGNFSNTLMLTNVAWQEDKIQPSLEFKFINEDTAGATLNITLKVHKQLYALRVKNPHDYADGAVVNSGNTDLIAVDNAFLNGDCVKFQIHLNVFVDGYDGQTYVCTNGGWLPYEEGSEPQITFETTSIAKTGFEIITSGNWAGNYIKGALYASDVSEIGFENFTITAPNVPYGTIRVALYKPTYTPVDSQPWESGNVAVIFDDIKAEFNPDTRPSGQTLVIANDAAANIKESMTANIGTVPANSGGALAFAGGVYGRTEWRTLVRGFRRDENDANPSALSVLTAKALMHHHRKTRNVYTGTIRYTLPYFESLLTIDGKTCAINAASYDILRNRMSGEYIEVEPYTDPAIELNDRVVSSGGSTIGSGTTSTTTTIIKVGGQAVEATRIYDLKDVPASDALSQYVVVDSKGQSTAKKVRLSEVLSAATSHNKGYYATLADLIAAFPNGPIGSIAYVGEKYPFTLFRYENGQWVNTGETGGDEHIDLSGYVRADQMADILYVEATEDEIEQMVANGTYDPTKVYYTTAEDNEQYVSADQIAALLFVETTEAEINKMIADGTYDPTKVYYTVED